MRIAYIVPSLSESAPVNIAIKLANRMMECGNDVTILYFKKMSRLGMELKIRNIRIGYFSKVNLNDYDVIHSCMFRPDVFAALKKSLVSHNRHITTIHNYFSYDLSYNYNWIIAGLASIVWVLAWMRKDKIVVLSNHAKQFYSRLLPSKKIVPIYNGIYDIDIDEVLPCEYVDAIERLRTKQSIIIGTYCVVGKTKNLEIAIRSLSRNPNFALVVIGDGNYKKYLRDLVEQTNVGSRCIFLPAIKRAHRLNKYIDVFIMPSRVEGFGLALVEAALYSARIVCSNIPIFRELFSEEEVTFFDVDDINSYDAAIHEATKDFKKGKLAMKKTKDNYMFDVMFMKYKKLYEEG